MTRARLLTTHLPDLAEFLSQSYCEPVLKGLSELKEFCCGLLYG